jgi:outer membrane protein assembly factor BamD (BamD/ComL family)
VEISALDRARDSLEAHRFAEALRLLGEYHRQFPNGRMRPEATVLRLTALIKSGQHEAARSLANQLLADDAYQTYAPRIRSLVREMQR